MNELVLKREDLGTAQDMYTALSRFYGKNTPDYKRNITGADVIDIKDHIYKQSGKRYPLWKFAIEQAPLSAWLYHEGSYWFAEMERLDVSSHGSTPEEAIEELEQTIGHFISFYGDAGDEELTQYAMDLRNKFSQITIR